MQRQTVMKNVWTQTFTKYSNVLAKWWALNDSQSQQIVFLDKQKPSVFVFERTEGVPSVFVL